MYLKKNRDGYKNSYNVNNVLNIPIPVSNTNLTVHAYRKTRLMGSFNIGSEFDKCSDCQIVFETGSQVTFEATLMENWSVNMHLKKEK